VENRRRHYHEICISTAPHSMTLLYSGWSCPRHLLRPGCGRAKRQQCVATGTGSRSAAFGYNETLGALAGFTCPDVLITFTKLKFATLWRKSATQD
jgi:hypothetical protein